MIRGIINNHFTFCSIFVEAGYVRVRIIIFRAFYHTFQNSFSKCIDVIKSDSLIFLLSIVYHFEGQIFDDSVAVYGYMSATAFKYLPLFFESLLHFAEKLNSLPKVRSRQSGMEKCLVWRLAQVVPKFTDFSFSLYGEVYRLSRTCQGYRSFN